MNAQRYRKRPVVVEAMQWTGDNIYAIWDWCGVAGVYGPTEKNPGQLILTTINGDKAIARIGDWIIEESLLGRFYPCTSGVFDATYERLAPLMTERQQFDMPDGEVIRPPIGMPSAVVEAFLEEWTKAVDRERDGEESDHRIKGAAGTEQPRPIPRPGEPSVQAAVRADLESRERLGIERYGTPLQPHNGRDALRDLYEELLDACCYIKQVLIERDQGGNQRIDGDLLADVIAQACPHVLTDNAARDTAERALIELADIKDVTVVRGADSKPWTPRDLQASPKPNQNMEDPDNDAVDARIIADEWLEFAVLLGADTADEEPTCLGTFDDDACAEELAQHVPGAWIGRRRVITHRWVRCDG